MDCTVKHVERIWIDIPYREIPGRNMRRELPHWTLFEICIVKLACGVSGFGETMCYYTHCVVSDEAVAKVVGRNASDVMWDDTLGAGLQMALFDAVGKVLEVPCSSLFGHRHRNRAAVSWWDIDMTGEDWLAECRVALDSGYTNFKTKARPWFDLRQQLDVLTSGLPDWFEIDLDFNGFLVDTARATRVIRMIEEYPNVAILETPIPHHDVAGMKRIRQATSLPVAMHYGVPRFQTAVSHDLCDGFVVGGGASAVVKRGAALAETDKIFWLQLVGTGITAAWSMQFAASLTHARWPAVNAHQLFTEEMVEPRMQVSDGFATIPDAPGLGVALDWDAVERYRIERKPKLYPHPNLLIAIGWPSGGTSYYAHTRQYWVDFEEGRLPLFIPGVILEEVENDGSKQWKDLANRAAKSAVHVGNVPGSTFSKRNHASGGMK